MNKNLIKYIVIGIGIAVVLLITVISLPIWTVPVTVNEKYTELETKQQPYVADEVYTNWMPTKRPLMNENITVFPFLTWNEVYKKSFSFNIHDNTLYGGQSGQVTAGANAVDRQLIFEWKPTDNNKTAFQLGILDCEYLKRYIAPWGRLGPPEGLMLPGVVEDVKSSGTLEYPLTSDCDKIQLLITTDSVININLVAYYQWFIPEKGIKQITKYLDVPVQVEKQRIVTREEKGSLWQLLFRK